MSWQAVQLVRDLEGDFTSSETHVLLILATYHNEQTGDCNPSVVKIAKQARMKRDTVYRALHSLANKGVLRIERPCNGVVNRYFFTALETGNAQGLTCPESGTPPCPQKGTPPNKATCPRKGTPPVPKRGHHLSPKRDTIVIEKKESKYLPTFPPSGADGGNVPTDGDLISGIKYKDSCPVETFVSVWNETLGDQCGTVSINDAARCRDVLAHTWAWYQQSETEAGRVATPSKMAQELRAIITEKVRTSNFLMGRESSNGTPFTLRFSWLMKVDTLVDIGNGRKTY